MEKMPDKFNMKHFEQEIMTILRRYFSEFLSISDWSYEDGEEYVKAKELKFDSLIKDLVPIAVNALKSSENKENVLASITKAYGDIRHEFKFGDEEDPLTTEKETVLLKKIIIDLARSK
jgi:hypothetical protein